MKRKAGIICMSLGTVLIIGALSLFLFNRYQEKNAGESVEELMPQLLEYIENIDPNATEPPTYAQPVGTPVEFLDPSAFHMTEVEIDGYGYIGYLTIPRLDLKLPVMADWDYRRLQIAPCRYVGSVRGEDLVLMAHNYDRHFGRISQLEAGDSVVFVDMDGKKTVYSVVGQDVLMPTAVEEMTAGEYDLTLFTCTYGGRTRVSVYCDRMD